VSVEDTGAEHVKLLKEILKWVRFAGIKEVKAVMETSLDTEQKRAAYHVSDGSKGTREVASKAGYGSKSTIEVLWKKWRRLGLGESFQVKGGGERFRRSFDLEDFEIEVPKSVRAKDNQSAAESPEPKNDDNEKSEVESNAR